MAGLPPGDPQLVSMIVNHLKTQGLFDQFRRDCLADVDTKPAYLNLKQRVDNFVSSHLSNHTWSPHLNKNQLRNNIRQLVLQSGMLEQGVDRIVAQVVDPKINHIFRPQVERVVREFLSPGSCVEEPPFPPAPEEMRPDSSIFEQASSFAPPAAGTSDAMSILDTITSLNQEASCRAGPSGEKGRRSQAMEEPMQVVEEGEQYVTALEEGDEGKLMTEEAEFVSQVQALEAKAEDVEDQVDVATSAEMNVEEEEVSTQERAEDGKDKTSSKATSKSADDKQEDHLLKSPSQIKQRARERLKEEYSLEDSDLEGLSDITVSSVHTSDLSSFEEESDDELPPSDSSEDGELLSDGERASKNESGDADGEDKERKPRRKAYVHKPFLYSRYYSDSDDEVTVEERRRSVAKDKEERLLKRQQNRDRMEEKRRQKAMQAEEQDERKRQKTDSPSLEGPRAKEARKERKVLEKKMALNRKRKLDSRKESDVSSKKKGDSGEVSKKGDAKSATPKNLQPKPIRKVSESTSSDERHRRKSGSVSEDSNEPKKLCDKSRTHSFILELEQGNEETLRQRSVGKFDRNFRKEQHSKERKEKERSLSEEHQKLKPKLEKRTESQTDESQQKEGGGIKVFSEEKGEKKAKVKSEKKTPGSTREGRASVSEGVHDEATKKGKVSSVETAKVEKEKEKDKSKDKDKEKDKVKDKEKDKIKGEKASSKGDQRQPLRPDSTCSSEDKADTESGMDGSKRKEKHPKEALKRSKSHTEDKQIEKAKYKFESKDGEREKVKADQESQKLGKSSSDLDKDPRKSKQMEKGKVLEKPRSKSREEVKAPSSLSKIDKKAPGLEVKSKGGTSLIKHDATKEKKKDVNIKDQRKSFEESLEEKLEGKGAKKKPEKKGKSPEKREESLEEKKGHKGDDKSEKLSKSSISSPRLETDEPPKNRPLVKDISTDSDPATATVATSISDDTYDAISDITPEPEDGDDEMRLAEVEPPPLPNDADALLTLMDVCTSADARLPQVDDHEEPSSEMALQDADMKMKEAALTLLSMDPDSTLSPSLITLDTKEGSEVNLFAPQPVETSLAEEELQQVSEDAQATTANQLSTAAFEAETFHKADVPDGKTSNIDASVSMKKEKDLATVQTSAPHQPQEQWEVAADQAPSNEALPADNQDENQPDVADIGNSKVEEMDVEDKQAELNVYHDSEEQNVAQQDENVSEETRVAQPEKTMGRVTRKQRLSAGEEESEKDGQEQQPPAEEAEEKVAESKTPRRGRSLSRSTTEEGEQPKEPEKSEGTPTRRGRHSSAQSKDATASNLTRDEGKKDEDGAETTSVEKPAEKQAREEEKSEQKKSGRRGRPAKPLSPQPSESRETASARKAAVKRKRSEDLEEESQAEEKDDNSSQQEEQANKDSEVSQPEDLEDKLEDSIEGKADNAEEEQPQEVQEEVQKKPAKRGRPPKAAAASEDSAERTDKTPERRDGEQSEDEEDNEEGETQTRTTTRAASRLEAERNKPSKPSTRASRQNGKEETTAGPRGTRGQAAAAGKGGRKREASPPVGRTRGGQKSDEPPSKRAKR